MNVHTFKNFLAAIALICLIPAANAQFDDVYYDPDADLGYSGSSYDDQVTDDITYYDDDEYEYYDDYDYYYSSRIKRFHRSYSGFDFYDPCYVSFNYYDPFYYDAYYYPGASIYISFGDSDYWGYRNWRRWNRYNRYSSWNNWCLTPASYYYSYNSWCAPSYNYWGGYHGYYSYSNYYNTYYNTCPYPVSNYNGVTYGTVTTVNNGGTRGSYYGPRITGSTGSSPRGPIVKPENVQPVMKGSDSGVTQSNDTPSGMGDGTKPGSISRSNPSSLEGEQKTPVNTVTRSDNPTDIVKEVPVDRELKRDEVTPTSRRPVFKPYPSSEDAASGDAPRSDRPAYKPTENNNPSPRDSYTPRSNDRSASNPARDESKPQYQPEPRSYDDRPRYTPPPSRSTPEEEKPSYRPRESNPAPSYSPPPSRNAERNDDRPSYSPPRRSNDSGGSNDRSSYSPSRSESSSAGRSSSSPSRDNSSGSSRSSSSGSPRSRG